jgi:hypothetical protein
MYALGNPQQCTLRDFLTAIRSGIIGGSVKLNAGYIANFGRPAATEVATVPRAAALLRSPPDQHAGRHRAQVYLEEYASAPIGGCVNLSASFAAGMLNMGLLMQAAGYCAPIARCRCR